MKTIKKVLSCVLIACLLINTAFAAPGGLITADDYELDTLHGHQFFCTTAKTYLLNQYTTGTPSSGTRVSTWKYIAGDATQHWDTTMVDFGVMLIMPILNRSVSLNIERTSSTASTLKANLYTVIGNYYEDACLQVTYEGTPDDNTTQCRIRANARTTNGVTYPARYLQVSSTATPVSDGNGTSFYCQWGLTSQSYFMTYNVI